MPKAPKELLHEATIHLLSDKISLLSVEVPRMRRGLRLHCTRVRAARIRSNHAKRAIFSDTRAAAPRAASSCLEVAGAQELDFCNLVFPEHNEAFFISLSDDPVDALQHLLALFGKLAENVVGHGGVLREQAASFRVHLHMSTTHSRTTYPLLTPNGQ